MNDQDDDKKNINQDSTEGNSENQPLVDETSQSESVKISSDDNLKNENQDSVSKNNDTDPQGANENQSSDALSEKKDEEASSSHQVIHKKDGRLHIYVRQDKYKGELKSKNWVGRLYIDGKQKISSSGTTNLDLLKVFLFDLFANEGLLILISFNFPKILESFPFN